MKRKNIEPNDKNERSSYYSKIIKGSSAECKQNLITHLNKIGEADQVKSLESGKTSFIITTNLLDHLKNTHSSALEDFIITDKTITKLEISFGKMRIANVRSLTNALMANSSITGLNLDLRGFNSTNAENLFTALSKKTNLTDLKVYLKPSSIMIIKVNELLQTNLSITKLDLADNYLQQTSYTIKEENIKVPCFETTLKAIKSNKNIVSLNLNNNRPPA